MLKPFVPAQTFDDSRIAGGRHDDLAPARRDGRLLYPLMRYEYRQTP
jgi:hypothetical protein